MAHFDEHCRDCERILGVRLEEVNRWVDAAFKKFGPRHRFNRHHWEGIRKAEELFGLEGRKAAMIHILKDCGHIPHAKDYETGTVDVLGMAQGDGEVFGGYWDAKQFTETAKLYIENDDNNQSIFGS